MPNVSSTIPNLINGVSQQPPHIRLTSQGERQVNGLSSEVDGLKKRPPSRFIDLIWDISTPSYIAPCSATTDPSIALISGITGDCVTSLGSKVAFSTKNTDAAYCEWVWLNSQTRITLRFALAATTLAGEAGCELDLVADEWGLLVQGLTPTEAEWIEKAPGFVASNDRISGSHTYTVDPCFIGVGGCTGQRPTITVPSS